MGQQMYCSKCKKTMNDVNFYTYRDGTKCELCKSCLTMHINAYDQETFMWLFPKFDIPWIQTVWEEIRDKEFAKEKKGTNTNGVVFGKYLSKMKLKQYKQYTWADTERIALEQENNARLYGNKNTITQEKLAEMEEAFKNGEISASQWATYKAINEPEPDFKTIGTTVTTSNGDNPYPVNDSPFEHVELPDVGSDLTAEDKIYLASKWGRLYAPVDWVYLEQKYNDFMSSFEIQGAARIDTLIQICKLSLKMNQSLDSMDMDSYSKLSRAYDTLMKSAKFTEAQRKEEKSGEFDCWGLITSYAEMKKGHIERFPLDVDRDIVDKDITDIKNYNKSLIDEDPAIFKLIEQYIKKKNAIDQQEKDLEEARAQGDEFVSFSDSDLIEYIHSDEDDEEEENL